VTSDIRATHTGAFNNRPGILVIAGTGSIVLGKNESQWQRAGGYGYRMGDEGSGHLIGTEGLRAAGRDYDGQQSTSLTNLLEQELNITSRNALIRWTYDADHTPSRIAPYVIQCAEEGDNVCQSILRRQIGQLIQLIQSLSTDLNLEKGPLSYYGGLFDSPHYLSQFRQALKEELAGLNFHSPQYNPRIGVCLMTGDF
jgi:N-acetylglucosamine kinase-like BadF-type ATPase